MNLCMWYSNTIVAHIEFGPSRAHPWNVIRASKDARFTPTPYPFELRAPDPGVHPPCTRGGVGIVPRSRLHSSEDGVIVRREGTCC